MNPFLATGKILESKTLDGGFLYLRIVAKELKIPKAGQFYMLSVGDKSKILKRPISLNTYDPETGTIDFIIKLLGKGTALLAQFKVGDSIELQGPLGQGFSLYETGTERVVVGGGVGISPLGELIKNLYEEGKNISFIVGAKDKTELESNLYGFDRFMPYVKTFMPFTNDGSGGYTKGFVNEGLKSLIAKQNIDSIFSCGPIPMLKSVADFAEEHSVETQLSLEQHMGCGVGACVCCAIATKEGQKRVCKDGPVFKRESVLFL